MDLYWHNVGTNGTINHNNTDDADLNKLIQVTVDGTSDLFDLESLKLLWYFNTMLSKRWCDNNNNNNNNNKTKQIDIPGITNWNVIHLKYLMKYIKKDNNNIPDKPPPLPET